MWCLIVFCCTQCFCDWSKAMDSLFASMNTSVHVTPGGAYDGQSGGLFTGGSFAVRSPARVKAVARLDMPSVDAGCSGIDLFTGGMSFISAQELVDTLKSIASHSASYAFGLALQTVTPQIKAVLDIVHEQMMRINALTLRSCETAAALVGGLWPKNDASRQLYCSTKGLGIGRFDDWASARQGCATQEGQQQVDQRHDKRFAHMLTTSFNLVWEALDKSGLFVEDRAWKEVLLSLTGTVIRDEQGRTVMHKALCESNQWLLRMIGAYKGPLSVYKCSDERCTTLRVEEISVKESLFAKLFRFCQEVCQKIRDGVALNDQERAFVEHSRVPVLKLLTVNIFSEEEVLPVEEIIEVIAFDVIVRWVEKMMHIVDEAVSYVRSVQIDDTAFVLFTKNMRQTRMVLASSKANFYRHARSVISLVERARMIEKRALAYGYQALNA